jgi:hypothetical protein
MSSVLRSISEEEGCPENRNISAVNRTGAFYKEIGEENKPFAAASGETSQLWPYCPYIPLTLDKKKGEATGAE